MVQPRDSTHEVRSPNTMFWVIAATALLSCGTNEATDPVDDVQFPAVALSITPNSSTLLVGEVAYLSAIALDAGGRPVSAVLEWSSANPSVATVGRTSGNVTAVGVGSTTVTVTSQELMGTATITVLEYHPAARVVISISTPPMIEVGRVQRLSAVAVDALGRFTPVAVEWTSEDPSVATVGRTDGQVTAVGVGTTTLVAAAGSARATLGVQVVPQGFLMQWASAAIASSEYESDRWSAAQAIGPPNVASCDDEASAWASAGPDLDWIELQYQTPVRPQEIRIHEVWAPGSIIKVEVKDAGGSYHTVYTASPTAVNGCLRTLNIPIQTITAPVAAVRLTLDQRTRNDWNEIDAVQLIGIRIN
jgi:hypothetical protein